MLKIKNLLKKYGEKTILDVKSLEIPAGIVHLKGINGSGKTTFSKIISGIIPAKGEVFLNEVLSPSKTKIAYRKAVNYSASEPVFPDFLTANDMISFVGKAKESSKEQQKSMAAIFGVDAYLHDAIGTYSSGMLIFAT